MKLKKISFVWLRKLIPKSFLMEEILNISIFYNDWNIIFSCSSAFTRNEMLTLENPPLAERKHTKMLRGWAEDFVLLWHVDWQPDLQNHFCSPSNSLSENQKTHKSWVSLLNQCCWLHWSYSVCRLSKLTVARCGRRSQGQKWKVIDRSVLTRVYSFTPTSVEFIQLRKKQF